MHITFKDIRQHHMDLQDKFNNRKVELQEAARKLVSEYIDSLSLPSESWLDANNVPRPYVAVGYFNENKLFQQMPLAGFDLDDEYKFKFKLSTTVDDSAFGGGSYYVTSVAIWKENGRLRVELDGGQETLLVANPGVNRPFFDVCVAIKQLVLLGCMDMRLD